MSAYCQPIIDGLESKIKSLESQVKALLAVREAAKAAFGWIAPVMDGFSIKENAESRRRVLNPLIDSLEAYDAAYPQKKEGG